jgi:uracil-DNA glycosylase family 4
MTTIVPPSGPTDCKIAFVGEAPGADEVRYMKPFVGKAGKIFSNILRSVGVIREHCYITNVVKERPPGNDISKFIKRVGKRVVTTPEFDIYREALYRELEEVKANVIVTLGWTATFALTGRHEITKVRGSILEWSGRKVIPTIHPSAIQYSDMSGKGGLYIYKYFIELDIRKAVKQSFSPEIKLPSRILRIKPTYLEAIEYIVECHQEAKVGFDIEVMRGEISCLSIAISPHDAMCIPFIAEGKPYFNDYEEGEIWAAVGHLLEDDTVTKVGQNIIFDAGMMLNRLGIKTKNVDDTMIAQGILTPDFPKGLDFITSIHTDEPYYKDEGKKWMNLGGSTEEDFWRYNNRDSAVCLEAFPKIMSEVQGMGNGAVYEEQRNLIYSLLYMQERGMLVDVEGIRKASEDAEKEIEELNEQFQELCGEEVNTRSPKQLATYFYIKKGYPIYKKGGKPTVDEKALKRLARKTAQREASKEATLLLKIRKLQKLKGTYLDMKLSDGRMKSAYNPVGAADSGRLSSSRDIFGRGGNLQTLPNSVRRFVSADPGYILYSMDLSQAENRIVAYIAPVIEMLDAFEKGVDIHSKTASLIFGIPIEEVSDVPGSCPLGNGDQSQRFWGKKANHGLNYGMGYKRFALENEMPEGEAKLIVDRYHAAYPGVRQYHNWVEEELRRNNRQLINPFGRVRVFLNRWGPALFNEASNFIPQSTVADIINRWGINFLYRRDFEGLELLNQIHDSLVFQIPTALGTLHHANCIIAIKESLSQEILFRGRSFRIPVDLETGMTLYKPSKGDSEEEVRMGLRKVKIGDSAVELSRALEVV